MDHDVGMFAQVMTIIVMSVASFVGIGLGARWLWQLGSRPKRQPALPMDDGRLARLEVAVETIAVEVERISESQRFTVNLLAERLPARSGDSAPPARLGRVNTPH